MYILKEFHVAKIVLQKSGCGKEFRQKKVLRDDCIQTIFESMLPWREISVCFIGIWISSPSITDSIIRYFREGRKNFSFYYTTRKPACFWTVKVKWKAKLQGVHVWRSLIANAWNMQMHELCIFSFLIFPFILPRWMPEPSFIPWCF